MTRPQARTLPTLWAFLMAALVVGGCAVEDESTPATAAGIRQARARVPEQQIFDYTFIETRDGIRQWVLRSAEMLKYPGQEDMVLVDLTMDFYRSGEYHSTLTADSGQANQVSRDVHAWGTVVVETNDGRKLETEELFFDNNRQIIHNDVFDKLTRDGDVVTGIGLEATPDLEYIELKEDVQAQVRDEETSRGGQGDR